MDASDRTNRRKSRTLFADKIIQQTIFDKGGRVWIAREGGVHTGAGSMTYHPNFYDIEEGAIQTTPAELAALVDSVPNKFPDPPSSVTAALVSGQVVVSFNAPTGPVTSYTVISNPGGIRVTGSSSPITVTGLTLGSTYTFTVIATNSGGSSAPSAPSNSVTTATVPDAPTGVNGISGNQEATIYFTDPASDGGSTILDYRVTGYVTDISFGSVVGSGSPITYTGLTNGATYTFTVAARNALGYSVESAPSAAITILGPPEAPTNLGVLPTIGGALLYFTAPNDGGAPITNYQYSTDNGVNWSFAGTVTSPVTVVGLSVGSPYLVKLRAINSVGPGAESAAVSAAGLTTFTPAGIANMNVWLDGQDASGVIIPSGGRVTAWNDKSTAANNFTASLTGIIAYDLPSGINNRPALNFTTSPSTYLSKSANLAPDNKITVFIVARQTDTSGGNSELFFTRTNYRYFDIFSNTNPGGTGLLSCNVGSDTQRSSGVDIINSPPTNALISFVVDATLYMYVNGNTTSISNTARGAVAPFSSIDATLDWALSGAGFLGNYGELICYSAALSEGDRQSVEGYLAWKWGMQDDLPAGHPYSSGPPAGPPEPPTSLVATAGDGSASIAFTPGNNGGSAITNYSYKLDGGSEVIFSPAQTASTVTIASLTNGTTYSITLSAINAIGSSVYSQSVSVTPTATPPPSGNLYTAPSVTSGVTTVAQSPFGGGGNSYSFNATNTYLNVVSDDSWDLGTGDFTIEWFQYQTDSNSFPRIFSIGVYPSQSIACSIEGGIFYAWVSGPTSFTTLTGYKNSWQHFAIVRYSGTLRVYRNGTQIGSSPANSANISNSLPLYIGATSNGSVGEQFGGYLTNIRIVKGLAVYTGNFTTPTSALTLAPGENPYGGSNTVAIPTGFTKLLLVP